MAINKEIVEYVAHLSRIELEPQELEKISGQLSSILDFIDKLKGVNTDNIAATSHILPLSNVLRQDHPGISLSSQKALANAPEKRDTFFIVPKVIE
ncbi:MAG: Asp-tRNA(Asn)/Glu-tRNA(Gln) amidotransferase subunit GatC [Candidatus Omnitrophota bacterium]